MTTRESSAGSGPSRGRGLDALFESSPAPSSSVPEIDAELAAMLEREVRAGAPPIESIESISLPAETIVRDEEAAAGGVVSAERGTPFPARGVIAADGGVVLAEDEAIDLPSPTADLPPIQTPSPVAPTPTIPVVGPTPSLPPPTAATAAPDAGWNGDDAGQRRATALHRSTGAHRRRDHRRFTCWSSRRHSRGRTGR